jgi:outer membrane lipoprotein-sorting protein
MLPKLLNFFVEDSDPSVFTPRYLGGDSFPKTGARAAIELVPKNRDRYIESIILTVIEPCPAVTRVLVVENKGAVIRVSLSNIQTNESIATHRFVFVPPKGTNIVAP